MTQLTSPHQVAQTGAGSEVFAARRDTAKPIPTRDLSWYNQIEQIDTPHRADWMYRYIYQSVPSYEPSWRRKDSQTYSAIALLTNNLITPGYIEELSESNPGELLWLVRFASLDPVNLSFAAEYLGRAPEDPAICLALVQLLAHHKPYVREGALYGLANYLRESAVREKLCMMSIHDSSEGVREIASELLE